MTRWEDPAFQNDLRRLLRNVRKGRGKLPPRVGSSYELRKDIPYEYRSIPGGTYLVEGDALALRRSLRRTLAGKSRRELGLSGDEAGVLLRQACDDAVAGTIKEAVANLVSALDAPIDEWTVAEPVEIFLPGESLRVGHATYTSRIPRSVARKRTLDLGGERFKPPIAYLKVKARGWQTARILAAERFAESEAILDLIDRPKLDRVVSETMLLRRREGSGHFSFNRSPWLISEGYVDERGRLEPPFRQLSRAAAKDEDARSDWERRVLAATRWLSRGLRTSWPADRLAATMVALECLFVAGMREPGQKGARIAARLSKRFTLNEMTEEEQVEWLEGLYKARNASVHEGREFVDDLDVDRLSELARHVVRELSVHLIAGHRYARHSCRTFDEAMRCSGRP
jgi:hypothetical protein